MKETSGIVDGVFVTIYERAIKDEVASDKSELPVYTSEIYVKKKVPNSRDCYDQPIKSTDIQKYGDLYEAFEKGYEVVLDGTPIEQWPQLDVVQVQTLQGASIFTVQALAELAESGMHRLPAGYVGLRNKAQKWLNQGLELNTVRQENADLLKRIEALEANQKKKPGRPRKVDVAT